MLEISFAAMQLLLLMGWVLFRSAAARRRGSFSWKREAAQLLFLINLMVICRVTFHPFAKVDGQVQPLIFDASTAWPFRINLIPFVNMLDYESRADLLLNLIGNFMLFVPTGILTPLLYRQLDSWKKTVLTGFLICLAIEIIQLPFAARATDVDDLILNTCGCLAGYAALSLVRSIRRKKK